MAQEINVLALVKGEERYVFLFDDGHRAECLRTLGRFASNKELSFTWYDAALLAQRVRDISAPAAAVSVPPSLADRIGTPGEEQADW